MAFYGRTYILGDTSSTKPGAYIVKWENGGDPGEYTQARGFMGYYEVSWINAKITFSTSLLCCIIICWQVSLARMLLWVDLSATANWKLDNGI